MKEPRYLAKNLQAELATQERSLRWLTGKVNAAGVSVSNSLMWYIAIRERTCSREIAQAICAVLGSSFFSLFESTDVESSSPEREEAVA